MRKAGIGIAVVVACLACGGGEVASVPTVEPARPEVAAVASGPTLPASWPAAIPSFPSPLYVVEVPGGVAGKSDLSANWQVSETMQQVGEKFSVVEASGWTRGFLMEDATMYSAAWMSPDYKLALAVTAMPDPSAAGKTIVAVVVSNVP